MTNNSAKSATNNSETYTIGLCGPKLKVEENGVVKVARAKKPDFSVLAQRDF